MPIDTSMYGMLQSPDFVGAIDKGMRLRDMYDARKENTAIKDAFKQNTGADGKINREGTLSALANAGVSPEKRMAFEKQWSDQDASDMQKKNAQFEQSLRENELVGQIAGGIKDQATYEQGLNFLASKGIDTSKMPTQYDPGLVNQYRQASKSWMDQNWREIEAGRDQKNKNTTFGLEREKINATRVGSLAKAPTADQSKAAMFAKRIAGAEKIMNGLAEEGFDGADRRTWAEKKLWGEAKPVNLQKLEQAQQNFINAVLRRESGAAISPGEFETARLQYFPQAGDDPQVLEQKRQNRLDVMAGMQSEAGNVALKNIDDRRTLVDQEFQKPVARGGPGPIGNPLMPTANAAPRTEFKSLPQQQQVEYLNQLSNEDIIRIHNEMFGGGR